MARSFSAAGVLLLAALAASRGSALSAGVNCSESGGCEEDGVECPPDSVEGEGGRCSCAPGHCRPPPLCLYNTHSLLVRRASGVPGDCCDVHDCVPSPEVNCTGVVCDERSGDECPADSYRLPGVVGECCTVAQGCACLPLACPPPPCPRPKVITPGTRQPGSCCPTYSCPPSTTGEKKSCLTDEGKEIEDGGTWMKGECKKCVCRGGEAVCASSCPPLPPHCTASTIPAGHCCPLCVTPPDHTPGGCKSGTGVIHENGAMWAEDDCTRCTCEQGEARCQVAMCSQACPHPTYISGECCPRCANDTGLVSAPELCPSLANCTLKCPHGHLRDENNCFTCKCKDECAMKCPFGYEKDSYGNEECRCQERECPSLEHCKRKCRHGYREDAAGCPVCKCHHCKPVPDCTKRCPHGLALDHRGCPMCKCNPADSSLNNNTTTDDSTLQCVTGGKMRDDGEAWFDGCRQCYCLAGREMCALVSCPKLSCPEPVLSKLSCCPSCPGNETVGNGGQVVCYGPEGGVRREGEMWRLSRCVECLCHTGRVLCHTTGCLPAPCPRPARSSSSCCPHCPPHTPTPDELGCGVGRPAGTSWREGPCVSCVCIAGVASCYTETCQADTTCSNPVQVKDQCCPLCFDEGLVSEEVREGCVVGNVTYNVGEVWEVEVECARCVCQAGRTATCTRTSCQHPPCHSCPTDESKDSGSKWWKEGGYLVVVGIVFSGAILALALTCYKRRHHSLSLAPGSYDYKYVPTYEAPAKPPPTDPSIGTHHFDPVL